MLSIKDVAARLGVSVSFAHKLVRNGDIESYRFGRCRRVSEEQLQRYLEESLEDSVSSVADRKLKYF